MLYVPESYSPYGAILGIDPGTETLGIASIEYDYRTFEIRGSEARTFKGSKLNQDNWVEEVHGSRFARIRAHCENLARILRLVNPDHIVSESPFVSRAHPQAGLALTELIMSLKWTVFEWNPTISIEFIDPPSVKNAVGAKGNADKFAVRGRVLSMPEFRYAGRVPIDELDEHSIDALAVSYSAYLAIKKYRAMWWNGVSLESLQRS